MSYVIRTRDSSRLLALAFLALGPLLLVGCQVDPYCLTCSEASDAATDVGADAILDASGADADAAMDAPMEAAIDAPTDASVEVCLAVELCDGLDNDCDGSVDEDFDLERDPRNCGACDSLCAPPHAISECVAGVCGFTACLPGFIDLNVDPADGCEYRCTPRAADDRSCDLRDDDCDGEVDEDVDLMTDPDNCGACANACRFAHVATPGCVGGTCGFDSATDCEPNFFDHDTLLDNGCEKSCVPTGPEVCDGADNNCDGRVDEGDPGGGLDCGQDAGECTFGTTRCTAGGIVCVGGEAPTAEICDGLDNNCDGEIDEGNPDGGRLCGERLGECSPGTEQCLAGAITCVGAVGSTAELCDGLDNDCDGVIDNGDPGGGAACGPTTGECTSGTLACAGGVLACVGGNGPAPELCDGLDNDCDGVIDNGNPGGGRLCGNRAGECVAGTEQCVAGALVCTGGTGPSAELCDGLDNDCDGTIDNGNPGGGAACGDGTGECAQGNLACVAGALVCTGGTGPSAELCDGLDNDCDGVIDNGDPEGGRICGNRTGECVGGREACVAGALVCTGGTGPSPELCDGLDNDCDGTIDNGNPGGGLACGDATGECTQGAMSCVAGALVCTGGIGPSAELCDGLDNDCDGVIDNGNPESGRICGNRVGECVGGTEQCVAGALVCTGAVLPSAELCDGLDNDCDGVIDNGDPGGGAACGDATGECTQGAMSCVAGALVCTGGTGPAAELCDGLDNDCDGLIDEGNPESGRLCGNRTGECAAGTEQCVLGALVCVGATLPSVELCDGLDNDCDGVIDNGNPGGGAACGDPTGECSLGALACVAGSLVCTGGNGPAPELCDGLDNDCDGSIDEGNPEGGRLCGNRTGECGAGTEQCVLGALVCVGTTGPWAEICDGLDNDCDGVIDNGNPGGGAACGDPTGECVSGVLSCVAGAIACTGYVGPAAELCDGLDNDCDGVVDDGNPEGGGLCGTDVGQCAPGTSQCSGGVLSCVGATVAVAEICNGLDDDCDGVVDDGDPDGGAPCGTGVGACVPGAETCLGGTLVCSGGTGPVPESCNTLDDDCDGSVDEGFDLLTDVQNCGSCGNACVLAAAVPSCVAGACAIFSCADGFQNLNGIAADGCEYACSVRGAEVCNGLDDDCDGLVDEGLTPPLTLCNPNGVCAGTIASCGGLAGWTCTYPATYEDTETRCDTLDNDCDGAVDEAFPLVGVGCSQGIGLCRSSGVYACNGTLDGVVCDAPPAGLPSDEICDGIDNDCDGLIDERGVDDPGTSYRDALDATAFDTVLVDRAGGGTMLIMAHEASRPDATATDPGDPATAVFACSRPNVMPWTNVNWSQARDACCAMNESGACPSGAEVGWRLCPAAEWQSACEGPAGSCDYSYQSSCASSQPLVCNGKEVDCDPVAAGDQDCVAATGAYASCNTDWAGAGRVYDLSGNVKEWTATSAGPGVYQIRGGAYTNIEAGRACAFDFAVADQSFAYPNTGFRCCMY